MKNRFCIYTKTTVMHTALHKTAMHIFVLALCCCIMLSFGGCIFDGGTNDEPSGNTAAVKSSGYSARTTDLANNPNDSLIRSLDGFTLEISYPYLPDDEAKKYYEDAAAAVNNEFGCNIQYVFEKYDKARLQAQVSPDISYDSKKGAVCYAEQNQLINLIENDFAADLTTAAKTAGVKFGSPFYNTNLTAALNINYKQYGWISDIGNTEFPDCIIYNKAMLVRDNLDDISDIVKNGDWDIDCLETYLRHFQKSGMSVANTQALFESLCIAKGQPLINLSTGSSPEYQLSNIFVSSAANTLDNWYNKSKLLHDVSRKSDLGLGDFIKGNTAFYFADSAAVNAFIAKTSKSDFAEDFVIVPFPNMIASRAYKNAFSVQYFSFIPKICENNAAKIMFLQNELYRNLSVNCYNLFMHGLNNTVNKTAIQYAFNMKYVRQSNSCLASFTAAYEADAVLGTNSFCQSIVGGESVEQATAKYKQYIQHYYANTLKKYKFTGKMKSLI